MVRYPLRLDSAWGPQAFLVKLLNSVGRAPNLSSSSWGGDNEQYGSCQDGPTVVMSPDVLVFDDPKRRKKPVPTRTGSEDVQKCCRNLERCSNGIERRCSIAGMKGGEKFWKRDRPCASDFFEGVLRGPVALLPTPLQHRVQPPCEKGTGIPRLRQ